MDRNNRTINEGFRFKDQRDALTAFMNMCFTNCQLASGLENSATIAPAVNVAYTIGGYFYSATLPSGAYSAGAGQASGTTCLYAITINSAGSVSVCMGSAITHGDSATMPKLPDIPSTVALLGFMRVSLASTVSYRFGSGGNSIGGILSMVSTTKEIFDCAMVPQGVILEE